MKLKEWQVIKQGQGTAAYLYLSSMRGLQSMQAIKNDAEAHIYLLRNNTFRRCRTEQSINHVRRPTDVLPQVALANNSCRLKNISITTAATIYMYKQIYKY